MECRVKYQLTDSCVYHMRFFFSINAKWRPQFDAIDLLVIRIFVSNSTILNVLHSTELVEKNSVNYKVTFGC